MPPLQGKKKTSNSSFLLPGLYGRSFCDLRMVQWLSTYWNVFQWRLPGWWQGKYFHQFSSVSCKYRAVPYTLSRDILIGCGFLPSPLSSYVAFLINKSLVQAWDFPLTSSGLALFYFGTIYDHSNCLPSSCHRMSFERTNTLFLQRLVFIGLKALTGTMNLINPLIAPGDN